MDASGQLLQIQRPSDLQPGRRRQRFQHHGPRLPWQMELERSNRRERRAPRWFLRHLNPTDGGNSQRYSLQAEWHRQGENSETKIMAYGFYYDLDLFSDFTYFLTDPSSRRPVRTAGQALGGWAGRAPHDFQPMVWPQSGKYVRPAGPQRLDQQRPLPDGRSGARGQN